MQLNKYERRIKNNFYKRNYLLKYLEMKGYISELIQEKKTPHHEEDINSWISKKGGKRSFKAETILISIEQDKRLRLLEQQYKAITKCLSSVDSNTMRLIKEFYLKDKPKYTFDYFAENELHISRKEANDLINRFIDNLEFELIAKS